MDPIDHYNEHGYGRWPGVFSSSAIAHIRANALMAMALGGPDVPYTQGGRIQTETVGAHEWPAIMFWPALINPVMNRARTHEKLVDIVCSVLGKRDIKQLNNQFYFRLPGGDDAFDWHTDVMFRKDVEETIADDYMQTVIVLDDWTDNNGGIMFDNSMGQMHLCNDKANLRKAPLVGSQMVKIYAGDVVCWKVTTPHASGQNKSNGPRMTYMNGFCRARSAPDAWPY
jgi:hypothetical protein